MVQRATYVLVRTSVRANWKFQPKEEWGSFSTSCDFTQELNFKAANCKLECLKKGIENVRLSEKGTGPCITTLLTSGV